MTQDIDTPHMGHPKSGEWDVLFQYVRETRSDVREFRKETAAMREDINGLSTQMAVLLSEKEAGKKSADETDDKIRDLGKRVDRLERAPVKKDRQVTTGVVSGIAGTAIGVVLGIKEIIAYLSKSG